MRILLATDQPFWQRRGGAHQRIDSLWAATRRLAGPSGRLADSLIYYLGDPQELQGSSIPTKLGPIKSVRSPQSNWWNDWAELLPRWPRFRNQPDLESNRNAQESPTASNRELTLSDYCWNWVEKDWNKTLRDFQPDVVILEYVTMTYLLRFAQPEERRRIVWAVDTHDCLSDRAAQFRAAGQAHWLNIDEAEEIAALETVDLVIAIQNSERDWFAQRLSTPQVITVEHGPKELASSTSAISTARAISSVETNLAVEKRTKTLRMGFLASNNFPNRHGILNWLDSLAKDLSGEAVELIVGGTIDDEIRDFLSKDERLSEFLEHVRFLGPVTNLADFYRSIDVSVCPIEVGTGLKIKLVESLAFCVPVLASPQAASDTLTPDKGVVVCRTPTEWKHQIHRLMGDTDYLPQLRAAAVRYAEQALSPAKVYGGLMECLQRLVAAKAVARRAGQE